MRGWIRSLGGPVKRAFVVHGDDLAVAMMVTILREEGVRDVIERQRKKAEIPVLEAKIDQLKKALDQHVKSHDDLVAKSQGTFKLTSQEKMSLTNFPVSIKHIQREIEEGEAAIAEARELAA